MIAAAVTAAEGAEKAVNELPFPPLTFGIVTFLALFALLGVTYAFRNIGSRH